MHGGDIIARTLRAQGVQFVFTLCGGHISPILIGCKNAGIRVIDVRHEATTVFAADAVARLTGIPGVAVVTAGPGVTNTITAVKNAQLAHSPVVLLGGATATALKGRGALQDIDQMALLRPHVKWAKSVKRVRELAPALEQAFEKAQSGLPGPVFVECPVDSLYDESLVRDWYGVKAERGKGMQARALQVYLKWHVDRLFAGTEWNREAKHVHVHPELPKKSHIEKAAKKLRQAKRPLLLIGSQALLAIAEVENIAAAVERLEIPVYLSGMARGLLGKEQPLQLRHKRRQALKDADVILLAGVPCDFRLDYGRHIPPKTFLIAANRDKKAMKQNRRPDVAVRGDVGHFLMQLSQQVRPHSAWKDWLASLRERDAERTDEIKGKAAQTNRLINPIRLCQEIETALGSDAVLIADGGDFVATASYIVRPPGPLSWLDPGVFGTLGVGAGFALGAKLCRPESEVCILYGDGSVGYSLAEFDTFVRHNIPVLAVVGNDASWAQIAREQVEIFDDDLATRLTHADYHVAAQAFGGRGFLLDRSEKIADILSQAREKVAAGTPAMVNALLDKTDFRKGSISM